MPRQCVFAGTINPEQGYLRDSTGNRRFWPVRCGFVDVAALRRDRDQLWAEAVQRFRAGDVWWLDTPELEAMAAEQQADRYESDAWDDIIERWLHYDMFWEQNSITSERTRKEIKRAQPLEDTAVSEILENVFDLAEADWRQPDQKRVARCLVALGFERYRARRPDGTRQYRYRKSLLP